MKATNHIKSLIKQSVSQLGLDLGSDQIQLEHPADAKYGDYSTNLALSLFKSVSKQYGSPRGLAEKLASQLKNKLNQDSPIDRVEVAGPGFINFWLSQQWLVAQVNRTSRQPSTQVVKQQVMVEFTDPNPFKEFHIGHLYSNTVGEAIARLLEWQGHTVKRACYQGDVGMHVAKSIYCLKQKLAADKLTLAKLNNWSLSERVHYLGQAYALGDSEYQSSQLAQTQVAQMNYLIYLAGQDYLVETQGWQPQVDYQQFLTGSELDYQEIKELYHQGKKWSLEYFEDIYLQLGTKFDEYFFESLSGEYGLKIVKEFLAKGVFEESDGAIIFPGEKYGLHSRVFVNSLGLPTYEAKELGLAPEKFRRFKYDRSIIITANEIDEYFKVLLKALSLTHPELAAKTKHISHGMVRLPDGKMSSRTGKILTGEWLIGEAQKKIKQILTETKTEIDEAEQAQICQLVGIAAIKFALLKSHVGGDIAFSFEESLSFSGSSGPYILYTYTRCQSVLRKAGQLPKSSADFDQLQLTADELGVLRLLYQFAEVATRAAEELSPHHVARYLFELAQAFSGFYTNCPILNAQNKQLKSFRLQLTSTVAQTLKQGLELLGIRTVEKM